GRAGRDRCVRPGRHGAARDERRRDRPGVGAPPRHDPRRAVAATGTRRRRARGVLPRGRGDAWVASEAMDVADSVLDLVGRTPLVRLRRLREAEGLRCDLLAKVEVYNPGGSVKDRPAVEMIDAAEREGLLKPGGTIVEPTSGNTGAGLAIVAAQRGYKCIF